MKRINGIEIATSETRSSSRPRLRKLLAGLIPRVYSFSNMAGRSVSQNLPKLHLRKQSKIGYNTMGNVVIEGNS